MGFRLEDRVFLNIRGVHVIYAIAILLAIATYLFLHGPPAYSAEWEGNSLVLQAENDRYRFQYYAASPITIQGKVIHHQPGSGIESGGVSALIHYMTEQEYEGLKEIKGCNAGYLNSHGKILMLIPDDKKIGSTISGLKLRRGQTINISGSVLEFQEGKINGARATVPIVSRGQYLVPTTLSVEERTVF